MDTDALLTIMWYGDSVRKKYKMELGNYTVYINRDGNKIIVYYRDRKLATLDLNDFDDVLGGEKNGSQ